ncbi:MAG: hypothetical protein AB7O24_12885 [Kofleriaceae bacterium]
MPPWLVALVFAGCGGLQPPSPVAKPCPAQLRLIIASQEDVTAAIGCTEISELSLRTGATVDVSALRSLERISGALVVGPTIGIEEVTLPRLREVGGAIQVASNGSLRGLFLPLLERAGGVAIAANVALTTVSLPRLAAVVGDLAIDENASLELLDVPQLRSVGGALAITRNAKLTLLEAASLDQVASVTVTGSPLLDDSVVEALSERTSPQ